MEKLNIQNTLQAAKAVGNYALERFVYLGGWSNLPASLDVKPANIQILEAPAEPVGIKGVGIPPRPNRPRAA